MGSCNIVVFGVGRHMWQGLCCRPLVGLRNTTRGAAAIYEDHLSLLAPGKRAYFRIPGCRPGAYTRMRWKACDQNGASRTKFPRGLLVNAGFCFMRRGNSVHRCRWSVVISVPGKGIYPVAANSPARTVRPRGKLNHRYVLTCRAQHRRGLYYREESTLLAGWALAISSHAELLQRIPAIRDSNACLATIGIEHTPFTDQGRQVAVFIECCVPAITIVVITICVTVN